MDVVSRVARRWITANTGLFIRFGQWRSSEQSYNYQTETWEKGVSVFRVKGDSPQPSPSWDEKSRRLVPTARWVLDLNGMALNETYKGPQTKATLWGVADNVMHHGSPIFLLRADLVGTGGDKEPVVRNLTKIKELTLDDVTDNKGWLDAILFRGRKDMRPKFRNKDWPRDESIYYWDPEKLRIMGTSKWDVEDGLEPQPS